MRISVNTDADTIPLEVADDLELENFKALCEMEVGIPVEEMVVVFNARPLTDNKKSLRDYGIKDGELVMILNGNSMLRQAAQQLSNNPMLRQAAGRRLQQQQQPQGVLRRPQQGSAEPLLPSDITQIDFGNIQLPGIMPSDTPAARDQPSALGNEPRRSSAGDMEQEESLGGGQMSVDDDGELDFAGSGQDDPAVIRDMLLANPEQLALLRHNNPRLAEALSSNDLEKFASVLREQQETRKNREQQRIRLLSADPFDMEAQRQIANEIQQENINANMEAAMEYNPESFGSVVMLYINCKVNGHDVKAFIDSGAQTTIMSAACAERCNIMRLVDSRWAGIAKGVGTQKIIGRVHMGQIQIEGDFLASSFCILEEQAMDMLLGLDMLKRHQMCIDLKNNKLHIGTTGTSTTFLSESELPDCARLTPMDEEAARKQSEKDAKELDDRALAEALAASVKEKGTASDPSGASTSSQAQGTAKESTDEGSMPPPPAPPSDSHTSQDNFTESDVQEIIQIGFTRAQAVEELRRQNGNKTQAIAALFAKSFKM